MNRPVKTEMIDELRALLTTERVLSLAVLRNGLPYVGLLPYVVTPDFSAALVHASSLALHTEGLTEGAPFGILIHRPDRTEEDPLQIQRLSLQGKVKMLNRGTPAYDEARQLYVGRFPTSARTFLLGDFNLYRLRFVAGRYVGGFARAQSLGPKDIDALGGGHGN